ncbi:unnamed protein product [Phytophthora fragariaefolia]|uniref:Unnamed protein product n=1 Tax=Phytophthora fragariaefolia TaxID=1490495 RepID=A0A9W7CSY3_9STRA|nr:unnamed protein product [Phytophthora fragariaefolia]
METDNCTDGAGREMATFRVLCLHGFGQDAPKFRNRISSLRRALKSSFDFGAPLALNVAATASSDPFVFMLDSVSTSSVPGDQLPELDTGRAGQNV